MITERYFFNLADRFSYVSQYYLSNNNIKYRAMLALRDALLVGRFRGKYLEVQNKQAPNSISMISCGWYCFC